MAIQEHNIKTFMGADFTIEKSDVKNLNDLVCLFLSWSHQVDEWTNRPQDVEISEIVIVEGKISVTFKDGIITED